MRYFLSLTFLTYILFLPISSVFAIRDIPDTALSSTVLLKLGNFQGSAFFLKDKNQIYLVTARHVLFKEIKIREKPSFRLINKNAKLISYPIYTSDPCKLELSLKLNVLLKKGLIKHHNDYDVAIIKLGTCKEVEGKIMTTFFDEVQVIQKCDPAFVVNDSQWIKKFDDILISNDVFIFGYPSVLGIPDTFYERPLIRKGIIAGKDFLKKIIILDCPSYPGNSGGPAFESERISQNQTTFEVIGIVIGFLPFEERWLNERFNYENIQISNSGYTIVMPIDMVLELLW